MNLPDAVPQINMTNLPTVGGGRVVPHLPGEGC